MRTAAKIYLLMMVVVTALVTMLTSCNDPNQLEMLHQVEALKDENPDSAARILSTLPREKVRGRLNTALYNLDSAELNIRLVQPQPSDSLIAESVAYFKEKNDLPHLVEARLYNGRRLYLNSD